MSYPPEVARGNAYLAPRPAAKILKWRPFRNPAGTMLGFMSIELPSGMIINDAKLMIGPNGTRWVAMPSIKAVDRDGNDITNRDGKVIWNDFVDFASKEARSRFQAQVLAALQRQYPELFDGGAP